MYCFIYLFFFLNFQVLYFLHSLKVSSFYTIYTKELPLKDMQNIDLPRYSTKLWFSFLRDSQVFLPECAI